MIFFKVLKSEPEDVDRVVRNGKGNTRKKVLPTLVLTKAIQCAIHFILETSAGMIFFILHNNQS